MKRSLVWLNCRVLRKWKAVVRVEKECRKVYPNLSKGFTSGQVVGWLSGVICTTFVGELGCLGSLKNVSCWVQYGSSSWSMFPEHKFLELTFHALISIYSLWFSSPNGVPDLYIQQPYLTASSICLFQKCIKLSRAKLNWIQIFLPNLVTHWCSLSSIWYHLSKCITKNYHPWHLPITKPHWHSLLNP